MDEEITQEQIEKIREKAWKPAWNNIGEMERLDDIDYIRMRIEYNEALFKMSSQTIAAIKNVMPDTPKRGEVLELYDAVHNKIKEELTTYKTLLNLMEGGEE